MHGCVSPDLFCESMICRHIKYRNNKQLQWEDDGNLQVFFSRANAKPIYTRWFVADVVKLKIHDISRCLLCDILRMHFLNEMFVMNDTVN